MTRGRKVDISRRVSAARWGMKSAGQLPDKITVSYPASLEIDSAA